MFDLTRLRSFFAWVPCDSDILFCLCLSWPAYIYIQIQLQWHWIEATKWQSVVSSMEGTKKYALYLKILNNGIVLISRAPLHFMVANTLNWYPVMLLEPSGNGSCDNKIQSVVELKCKDSTLIPYRLMLLAPKRPIAKLLRVKMK